MPRPSLINFTPASDPNDLWKDGQQQPPPEEPEPALDGAAARAFYEALIGDESLPPEPQISPQPEPSRVRKRKKRMSRMPVAEAAATAALGRHGQGRSLEVEDKMTQWILRAAQEGDLAELQRLLDPREAGGAGGNINARDTFWWTPLMCAARAGQGAAVRYLLDRGAAWVGVCELGGRDAAQLAEEAGFPEVARMVRESHGERRSPENRPHSPSPQYCETCGAHFQDSNHSTSTAHLLSLSWVPQPSNLPPGVSASNPGFKLLLRGGWEPGMGLGPRGEGRASPIPTVLKRDQEGLGYRSPPQPRVTHFPAWDTRAVAGRERAPRVATLSRKEERRREEKGRAWERDLRRYMSLEF
ncbi:G patch domain and ankyrin repeat-containing protein 1 [Dasypus novemcinctus]|uniref:G patch domain and ankyrin repeat-containing protein 1 n=1 Tax=Dasypus novemcinctus TaxID=9361 RepID=UPI0000E38B0B|nr:G patch domain and ankyrin repeat-containing protein 1 [Dasypus novemcinctus]XP_004467909.1 G patch domain and ankyrin repeat-containing protein 1 [Dasypus novemcinctus]XP_012384205.1 G patch domain and ankyrin repeat-containing protein 1 [Dasypus novemcinctus]XP_023447292.1 G patch domain and ankyrin repeat-containing protein 1 [Dasypus novemcinctus]XP_058162488.1 G patch domain and ankyrin repeat-containing protein 1 [Dasypus novemcinctus]